MSMKLDNVAELDSNKLLLPQFTNTIREIFREHNILQRAGFSHSLCQRAFKSKFKTKSFDFITTKCWLHSNEMVWWVWLGILKVQLWEILNFDFSFQPEMKENFTSACLLLSPPRTELQHFSQLRADSHLQCWFPVCSTTFSRILRLKLSAPIFSRSTD